MSNDRLRKPMSMDCYDLPGDRESVGVSFTAEAKKSGTRFFFWVPDAHGEGFRLYRWEPEVNRWKVLEPEKLPGKRLAKLRTFWAEQTDIGLWIANLNRKKRERRA